MKHDDDLAGSTLPYFLIFDFVELNLEWRLGTVPDHVATQWASTADREFIVAGVFILFCPSPAVPGLYGAVSARKLIFLQFGHLRVARCN